MSEVDLGTQTPAVSDNAAPATPVATPQAPAAPVAAATPTATTSAPQVEPSWLKQRLEETRQSALKAAQQHFGQTEAQYKSQLEQMQSQIRALVGVNPPQNPEIDAIRNQFASVFPDEWKLMQSLKEKREQLDHVLERAGDYESSTNHYWQTYGRQTVDSLYSKMAEAYGGQLSDDAKKHLYTSFVGYVQSSPENEARYGQDPSIVDDFVKAFTSNFIDPARRAASAQVVNRAPFGLPQDNPSGAVPASRPAQMNGLDERSNAAWTLFNTLNKQA